MRKKKKHTLDLSHMGKEVLFDVIRAVLSAKSVLAAKGMSISVKKGRKQVNTLRNNCRAEG
jgi:hypothetical protein